MLIELSPGEVRTPERLRAHYEIERELADRLRNSSQAERATLYADVYNELFRRVPDHPQLTRVKRPGALEQAIQDKMRLLRRYLTPETVFLEMGAGDCRLTLEAAKYVKRAYALDVSSEVSRGVVFPANGQFVLSGGTDVPLPRGEVTLAYSYQLLEHVHPVDVVEQLRNVREALAPGGRYVCITPNRLGGPHDISKYFEETARGLHLKEYTLTELDRLFRSTGYDHVSICTSVGGSCFEVPAASVRPAELLMSGLPYRMRRRVSGLPGISGLLLSAVVARKGGARR